MEVGRGFSVYCTIHGYFVPSHTISIFKTSITMLKVILTKKLYAEIHKWEDLFGISGSNNMRLLKLYIGMGIDFLINKEGKVMCQDFNKLGKIFHYHNPKKIIEMVVKCGSFSFEKCDSYNMNIYGIMWFSSPVYANSTTNKIPREDSPENSLNPGLNLDIYNNNIYGAHSGLTLDHPHGPHEFCYPGSTQRLYDFDGSVRPIPDDAPDRPSPTAQWSKFQKRWDDITVNTSTCQPVNLSTETK